MSVVHIKNLMMYTRMRNVFMKLNHICLCNLFALTSAKLIY